MSIFAYVGLPGSGKTYAVVANQILPALKRGRRVVTNVPLNRDEIRKVTPRGEIVEFPTEAVAAHPELIDDYCTPGSVVVLDELWRLWPSGLKAHQVPISFKSFLAEHRHKVDSQGNSMQIVLVTQDLGQIAAFARQLVEITCHHTQLSYVGANRKYRVDIYRGPVSGPQPPESRRIRQVYGTYRAEIYRLYKSHTMSEAAKDGANERPVDDRGTIWKRPSIYAGALFVVGAPAFAIPTLWDLLGSGGELGASVATAELPPRSRATVAASSGSVAAASVTAAPSSGSVRSVRSPPPIEARIVGWIQRPGSPGGGVGLIGVAGERQVFEVPWSSCWQDGGGLTRCMFNGQVVTELGVVP